LRLSEDVKSKAIATLFSSEHLTISETFLHSVVELLKSDKKVLKGYSVNEDWGSNTTEQLKVEIGEIEINIKIQRPR